MSNRTAYIYYKHEHKGLKNKNKNLSYLKFIQEYE